MKIILKFLSVPLVMIALSSCSLLDAFNPVKPTIGVEATVGKTNNVKKSAIGQVGNKQEVSVESLSGGFTTINKEEIPLQFMLLMILGWLLPSPLEIWKGFVNTVKGIADFILKLLRGNNG